MEKSKILLVFFFLLLLLAVSVIFLSIGCKVLSHKQSSLSDSINVKKENRGNITNADSGNVNKTNSSLKEENEWWRTTIQYLSTNRKNGDTTINNNYYTQPQPSVIVMEGGKGKIEQQQQTYDSGWLKRHDSAFYARLDSMNRLIMISQTDKKSESKGLGLWTVILIVTIGIIGLKLVGYGVSNFRLVKK